MVLEEIDRRLDAEHRRGWAVRLIRLGEYVLPDFVAEMASSGSPVPTDGSPISYKGVPVAPGAIDPESIIVESEPQA